MTRLAKMLPLCGFVIAVALVVLTSSFKAVHKTKSGDTLYAFEYTGPSDYSAAHVQDVSNWTYEAVDPSCSGSQKACSINVTSDYADPSGSSYTLDPSVDIQTAVNGSNQARVTGIADTNGSFANKN